MGRERDTPANIPTGVQWRYPCTLLVLALLALGSAAGCGSDEEPERKREILMQDECTPPVSPRVPQGESANAGEMREAREHVMTYISQGYDYIDCVDFKAKTIEEDRGAEGAERYRRLHEQMFKQMKRIEDEFNRQVRIYRERTE